jgi:hypothetical protein
VLYLKKQQRQKNRADTVIRVCISAIWDAEIGKIMVQSQFGEEKSSFFHKR